MRKNLILGTLVVILLFSTWAVAQEKPPIGDSLRWFPDGQYRELRFFDKLAASKVAAFKMLEKISGFADDDDFLPTIPLPDFIMKEAESICHAVVIETLLQSSSTGEVQQTEVEKQQNAESEAQRKEQAEQASDRRSREATAKEVQAQSEFKVKHDMGMRSKEPAPGKFWVLTCAVLEPLLKKAEEAGDIVKAGLRLFKRPVYAFGRNVEGAKEGYFAYATPTNELLVANNLDNLKLMVRTGMGMELSAADNQEYIDALGYLTEPGQIWKITPKRVENRAKIEQMRKDFASEEKIQLKEDELDKDLIYEINDIHLSDESMVIRQISVFGEEERAKQRYNNVAGSMDQAKKAIKEGRKQVKSELGEDQEKLSEQERRVVNQALGFANKLVDSQQTTLEGSVLTTTITFGERQLKTLGMLLDFAKMMEQKEEAKEEREDK